MISRLSHIISAFLLLILVQACSKEGRLPAHDEQPLTFSLRINVPSAVVTKSAVSGAEGIYGMQLLCFDANNMYLGLGAVVFNPDGGAADAGSGTLRGSVPAGTSAIHFVANAGLVPLQEWRNQSDAMLVGSLKTSSSNTHIVYWGYHKEDDAQQMNNWLNASPSSTVRLLRDRAKITLDAPDPDWDHNPSAAAVEHIVSARFAVCNGLEHGMLAPYDKALLGFSYDAPPTLPDEQSRYMGAEEELTSPGGAQFLFEDENSLDNPVKVILEAIYEITEDGVSRQEKKFHQIMLMRDDYSLFKIRRNHQYNIIIGNLPAAIAYNSFAEALAGSPSNNQTVYVQEIVPQVMVGDYSLDIPDGTTRIFQKEQEGPQTAEIRFCFLEGGNADPNIGISNFAAIWLSNKYVSPPGAELSVVADSQPGYFRLLIPLYHPISDDLKSGKILLIDRTYGLARYLNIYSISAFDFNASLTQTGDADNPFLLRFTIPESFPAALFPFAVRIATEDLKPTQDQNEDQALGVIVADSIALTGETWNYWHTYDVFNPGTYNVLLTPVAGHSGELRLWITAEFFGLLDSNGDKISDAVLLTSTY